MDVLEKETNRKQTRDHGQVGHTCHCTCDSLQLLAVQKTVYLFVKPHCLSQINTSQGRLCMSGLTSVKREVTLKVVTIPELKFTERTATALLAFITGALAVNLPSVGSIRLHVQPLPHNSNPFNSPLFRTTCTSRHHKNSHCVTPAFVVIIKYL